MLGHGGIETALMQALLEAEAHCNLRAAQSSISAVALRLEGFDDESRHDRVKFDVMGRDWAGGCWFRLVSRLGG